MYFRHRPQYWHPFGQVKNHSPTRQDSANIFAVHRRQRGILFGGG
jgi:hypothetical protein